MAYEIVMPQLSDSMEEGKLISWNVKEGKHVKSSDIIAEIESDKAIMELQSFRDGVVKHLYVKAGESVPVGTVIAEIETDTKESDYLKHERNRTDKQEKKEEITIKEPVTVLKPEKTLKEESVESLKKTEKRAIPFIQKKGTASPKARAIAARYGFDIAHLQHEKRLPSPVHEAEIKAYALKHYFTAKARKLLEMYQLDSRIFIHTKKYDSSYILSYIKEHDIPLPRPIEPFHQAVIEAVTRSAEKPVYHMYDTIDATLFKKYPKYTMTVWLIKLIAEAMMQHETFRSTLGDRGIQIWPNASISFALSHANYLYMPVIKHANRLSLSQIEEQLKIYENKAVNQSLSRLDMQGSNFGISNLGMFGIARFDAMINQNDSGIAAIGSAKENSMTVTLTLDHRLINGYQGAEFMRTLKHLAKDAQWFKGASHV